MADRMRIARWSALVCGFFALALTAPPEVRADEEGSLPGPLRLSDGEAMRLGTTTATDLTFEVHVQDADIKQVLQLLSTQGRKNIVATKEITGNVTADLYGVTFHEALDAVVKAAGYVYVEDGNFVYVYTPAQLEAIRKA